jgi:hypothetical protein
MVNRAAIILKYKKPFIQWLNESDPYNDNPGITLENANEDCTVYLIHDEDAENVEKWISFNFMYLFESELESWYTQDSLWPKDRNRKLFDEWFEVECHSLLISQWVDYMKHLKKNYPYLFSLAIRINPFNPDASAVVTES